MVFMEGKKEVAEGCLMVASLSALICHPNATIKCFRSKSSSSGRQKLDHVEKHSSKSKSRNDYRANSTPSRTSISYNNIASSSSSETLPISRSGRVVPYLLSNLGKEEASFGVLETIFRSGWDKRIGLRIESVLKINHGLDLLNKFEEYRETIKAKSTHISSSASEESVVNMERLAVDGNELLRFHGAILTCSLGEHDFSNICYRECCATCRMMSCSLSQGEESMALRKTCLQAHKKAVNDCAANKVCARKAIVVCRVIAGRVARYRGRGLVAGQSGAFDSVISMCKDELGVSEELVVLNARAVLPCFVVLYNA